MENLSILKLFSSSVKTEAVNKASETVNNYSTQAKELESGFEDVFRSYLDKTENAVAAAKKAVSGQDTATAAQKTQTSESSKTSTLSKVSETAGSESASAETESAETPEEVIDGLNVSEEVKEQLKKMLSEIETADDAEEFMAELMAAMITAQMTMEQAETALTQLAGTLLDGESDLLTKQASPILLEQVLDDISDVLEMDADSQELFVMPEKKEQTATVVSLINEGRLQLKEQQTASAQMSGTSEVTAQVKQETKAVVTETEEIKTEKITVTADSAADDVLMDMTSDDSSADAGDMTQNEAFTARTFASEKVITTEIKIERASDIMKFAELVEIAKSQGASKITVQLNPLELGKVNIELTEQAGKINGKVTFESEAARNLFASNIDSFKQQMAEKGIIVDNLEFLFKDFEHHEFAGWENEQKKGGSGTGGQSGSSPSYTDDGAEEDASAVYA